LCFHYFVNAHRWRNKTSVFLDTTTSERLISRLVHGIRII